MKLDKNLAAVHAYLCADGYVIKNPEAQKHKYFCIGFRNTNLVLLKDFQDKFEKVFGVKPHLIEGQRCRVGSKEIYEKLTKEFGSFYSWKWRMPKLNKKLANFCLRAYFVCEGWVTCESHKNRMIGADCVNEKGIKQIKGALKRLGIESIVKKRNTRNIYSLKIYGKENIIRFNNQIGFLHPEKKEKINRCINDFVKYELEFPIEEEKLREFIKEILKNKSKISSNKTIRIVSNRERNLIRLQKELNRFWNIQSKFYKRVNGIGTEYYELDINKQEDIKKLIENNLINKDEKEKWLKLRE
jgi:hypothetical protein